MWKHRSKIATPQQVAAAFAAETFPEPREADLATFTGCWRRGAFAGSFRLVDGVRMYAISGRGGEWTVEQEG